MSDNLTPRTCVDGTPRHGACCAEGNRLRAIIRDLERQIAEHRCQLPPSIQEALNSGDGSYHP